MFSFQGAVCTKIDVDGCKNAIASTGSILAIFSWFLYWKMCDRLATIRIWCYTCSCSGNSIDSFVGLYLHMEWYWRIIQKIDALASVGLLFCFQLYYLFSSLHMWHLSHSCLYVSVSFDGIIISPCLLRVNDFYTFLFHFPVFTYYYCII